MSLYGKEKIWFLIDRLLDEREVTEAGQPVALHPMNDLNGHYGKMDFIQLTEKLEKEHKAIKLLNQVPTDQTYGKYLIELLPNFDNYVQELHKDTKYRKWAGVADEPEPTQKTEPISVNHARKNGVMTGKEKIQAVVEVINNAYQGLVTGNTVLLHSGSLEQRGLQLHEQKQALDILANDKKVINYTAKNEYESRADIHPRDQVDIHDVAMDELHAQEMFDELLAQQQYKIEVLPTFAALADELLGDAELEYQKDVYLLRLLYESVIDVLDAVVSAGVVIRDDALDFTYIKLTSLIESVLSKPSMKSWKDNAPELYETLLGHSEEIGEGWQYARTNVAKYYAKLQKDWMLNGSTEFELDNKLTAVIDGLNELIIAHRKAASEASENWRKNMRKGKVIIDKQPKPQPERPDDTASDYEDEEPVEQKKPSEPKKPTNKVLFDIKTSTLSLGKKDCLIPDESLEHYVCKLVFKNRRVAAKEIDILEAAGVGQDSQRPVYDAHLRVNAKVKRQLGLDRLLTYRAAKVRLNKVYK